MENLTVIIPFFNEEKLIEQSLDRVLKSNIADKYKKKKNLAENLKLSLKFFLKNTIKANVAECSQ